MNHQQHQVRDSVGRFAPGAGAAAETTLDTRTLDSGTSSNPPASLHQQAAHWVGEKAAAGHTDQWKAFAVATAATTRGWNATVIRQDRYLLTEHDDKLIEIWMEPVQLHEQPIAPPGHTATEQMDPDDPGVLIRTHQWNRTPQSPTEEPPAGMLQQLAVGTVMSDPELGRMRITGPPVAKHCPETGRSEIRFGVEFTRPCGEQNTVAGTVELFDADQEGSRWLLHIPRGETAFDEADPGRMQWLASEHLSSSEPQSPDQGSDVPQR